MNIDEVVLRAYVDGELPAAQAAVVEEALAGSEELGGSLHECRPFAQGSQKICDLRRGLHSCL